MMYHAEWGLHGNNCRKPSIKIRIVTAFLLFLLSKITHCRKPSIKIRIVTFTNIAVVFNIF